MCMRSPFVTAQLFYKGGFSMPRLRLLMLPSVLLLVALSAGVGFGAAATAQPTAASATAPLVSEPPGLCQAKASMLAAPVKQVPLAVRTAVSICGSCSQPVCRGVGEGAECRVVGQDVYTCIPALGNTCTDGSDQCQCWYGPLP